MIDVIGAVDELGQMPYYAENCASMLATTYSSGQAPLRNIVSFFQYIRYM
jgi:proprotein convertase subtilisin/kexin type 7